MVFPLNQILNVSPNLQITIYLKDYLSLLYFFFDDVEEHQFPSYCTTSYLNLGGRFFSKVTWVLQLHTVWSQKKIGLLILLNCEPASLTAFTTIGPKEQQTSDNLIVKDYCFIIEIFDKFSFSGILRGCLRHFNWSLEKISISQTTGNVK